MLTFKKYLAISALALTMVGGSAFAMLPGAQESCQNFADNLFNGMREMIKNDQKVRQEMTSQGFRKEEVDAVLKDFKAVSNDKSLHKEVKGLFADCNNELSRDAVTKLAKVGLVSESPAGMGKIESMRLTCMMLGALPCPDNTKK